MPQEIFLALYRNFLVISLHEFLTGVLQGQLRARAASCSQGGATYLLACIPNCYDSNSDNEQCFTKLEAQNGNDETD